MQIQSSEIQLFKKAFDAMFPNDSTSSAARRPSSEISTTFHPTNEGTLLVAENSQRSLARVISSQPCKESFACSHHWLEGITETNGRIDVANRGNLVEFRSTKGDETFVLSLVAQCPSTTWASPVLGSVDERFVPALNQAANLLTYYGAANSFNGIHLDGRRGTVTTECKNETISHSGFQFPWGQTVSIQATDVFASLGLSKRDQVACGVLYPALFISAGRWRLQLPLTDDLEAIDIEAEKKNLGRVSNRLQLDPRDLAFSLDHLKPYTANLLKQQQVTFVLDKRVAVAIDAAFDDSIDLPRKRLVLSRSGQKGKPTIIRIKSWHLRHIAKLGLTQFQWHGDSRRLSYADERFSYFCKSSPGVGGLSSRDDVIEIDSATDSPVAA